MKIFQITTLTVALLTSSGALAAPLIWRGEGAKDKRQFCYTTLTVNPDGTWVAETKFSNGRRVDRDNFVATLEVLRHDGSVGIYMKQSRYLDGSAGGRARERIMRAAGKIDPSQISELSDKTRYTCTGVNKNDDEAITKALLKVVEALTAEQSN